MRSAREHGSLFPREGVEGAKLCRCLLAPECDDCLSVVRVDQHIANHSHFFTH